MLTSRPPGFAGTDAELAELFGLIAAGADRLTLPTIEEWYKVRVTVCVCCPGLLPGVNSAASAR